jgi:hypothetical protein
MLRSAVSTPEMVRMSALPGNWLFSDDAFYAACDQGCRGFVPLVGADGRMRPVSSRARRRGINYSRHGVAAKECIFIIQIINDDMNHALDQASAVVHISICRDMLVADSGDGPRIELLGGGPCALV